MEKLIRILLVDDQRLMRDGLKTILELEEDIKIVGEAENGLTAIELFEELQPSLVLMDIRMPILNGVESTQQIMIRWPEARVIILTTFDDDQFVFDGLRAGALGYLLKDVSGEELTAAIRTVAAGGALIEPSIARKVLAEFSRMPTQPNSVSEHMKGILTDRETEILRLIAQGMSNKQIASNLFLAEGTVKNYVTSVLTKLDAADRTQAALRARELGFI